MASAPGRNVKTVHISRETACKRCGASGLGWLQNAQGKWYLVNAHSVDGQLCAVPADYHNCGQHTTIVAQISREQTEKPVREEIARLTREGQQAMIRQEWEKAGELLVKADELKSQLTQ